MYLAVDTGSAAGQGNGVANPPQQSVSEVSPQLPPQQNTTGEHSARVGSAEAVMSVQDAPVTADNAAATDAAAATDTHTIAHNKHNHTVTGATRTGWVFIL